MSEKLNSVKPETRPLLQEEKRTKIYPTFQIDDEDLPEIKNWKVGSKYMLVMEVEQMSMRQGKEWQGSSNEDKKVHATFKILKIGVEKEDYAKEYARKRSNSIH